MQSGFPFFSFFITLVILATVAFLGSRFRVIKGKQVGIIEYLGNPLERPARSGLMFLMPFHKIRFNIDLRQQQIEKTSSVKTKDDAFINVSWVLRYSVKDEDAAIMAYCYKVEKPVARLIFKVENELRQIISSMTMNELYSQRDTISQRVMADQASDALETGLWIDGVVIEQPLPPVEVQNAMNNKTAAIARQDAAKAEAEAERVKLVGVAKAEAESKKLQGEGIAQERQAIVDGFAHSVETMKSACPGVSEEQIIQLLTFTMQADMVTTASREGKSTVIFVPTNMVNAPGDMSKMITIPQNV